MDGYMVLRRARATRTRLRGIDEALARLRESATALVPAYGGVRTGGSADDAMAAMCARLDELEREGEELRRVYAAELVAANDALSALDVQHRTVMYRYYIGDETLAQIATAMDRTPGTVKRLKRESAERLRARAVEMPDWYAAARRPRDTLVIPQ